MFTAFLSELAVRFLCLSGLCTRRDGASGEIGPFQLFQADNGQIRLDNEACRFDNEISIAFKSESCPDCSRPEWLKGSNILMGLGESPTTTADPRATHYRQSLKSGDPRRGLAETPLGLPASPKAYSFSPKTLLRNANYHPNEQNPSFGPTFPGASPRGEGSYWAGYALKYFTSLPTTAASASKGIEMAVSNREVSLRNWTCPVSRNSKGNALISRQTMRLIHRKISRLENHRPRDLDLERCVEAHREANFSGPAGSAHVQFERMRQRNLAKPPPELSVLYPNITPDWKQISACPSRIWIQVSSQASGLELLILSGERKHCLKLQLTKGHWDHN